VKKVVSIEVLEPIDCVFVTIGLYLTKERSFSGVIIPEYSAENRAAKARIAKTPIALVAYNSLFAKLNALSYFIVERQGSAGDANKLFNDFNIGFE